MSKTHGVYLFFHQDKKNVLKLKFESNLMYYYYQLKINKKMQLPFFEDFSN